MDLNQFKEDINKAGFSSESLDIINGIVDKAIKRGNLEKEESDEIYGIIEVEAEAAKIEVSARKQIAAALEDYTNGIDMALEEVFSQIEKEGKEVAPSFAPSSSDR